MSQSLSYIIIFLFNMLDFSSGVIYNKATADKNFICFNSGSRFQTEIIKLFLHIDDLEVECYFQPQTIYSSSEFLSMFTSGGRSPSLTITNSTYSGVFYFNLSLFDNQDSWFLTIPRENITEISNIAAVEEWLVRVTFQNGLNIYTTEGTLLDSFREPILQWSLGTHISIYDIRPLYSHVVGLKVTKSPCANDVALVGLIMDARHDGVYIGTTSSGLWEYMSLSWFDLSEMIYKEVGEEHTMLSVVDMVLTNHFLVILTSLGLFISNDLRAQSKSTNLKFSRAAFCGFERVDYIKGKLWYNENCFANREIFEVDYVTITFERNKTLSESSSCFFSKEPFREWLPCLPHTLKRMKNLPYTVITFLIDQELHTGVYLHRHLQGKTTVSVNILRNGKPTLRRKFPFFSFPSSFTSPVGMVFHPRSHFLYVYGNQVWFSVDGGNTFDLLTDLHDDIIINTYHSFYTSDIIFVSQKGMVYFTKAGLKRHSKLGSISEKVYTLYFDHLGYIHKLLPDSFDEVVPQMNLGDTHGIFRQSQVSNMGFETALAPQYITSKEMIFFAYVPPNEPKNTVYTKKFDHIHLGKMIHSGKFGEAYIREIMHYDTADGFLSTAITEVVHPFALEEDSESSCLLSSLLIQESKNLYKLTLQSKTSDPQSVFQDSDIEKTVVIPGYSSFLITSIIDDKNALAIATMPEIVPNNMTFPKNSWLLYNFGQKNGQPWKIHPKPCNYWFQQLDSSLALNFLKYIDLGKSQTLKFKVIPASEAIRTFAIPVLRIIAGNPNLLTFQARGMFDGTDSYTVEISATSKDLHQGSTSVALIIWGASTECFVTTVVPILKSSCSYLKIMYHVPIEVIPNKDWDSGIHKDSQGFNMIKTLPINYRPPSNMGIAIPLTDNFYHADPSKPIPRNLFHKSKKSGKYKQCTHQPNREKCNCTYDQKFSYAVAFSDCREKVPRFKFPVTQYPVTLAIHSEHGHIPMQTPYLVTITEVNERGNWRLKDNVPENVKMLKDYLEHKLKVPVYNPLGLNLSIKGSELFHFRVSIVPGVTFCNLVDEFQIYVDEVPLPFPGRTLIALASAVLLGGLIFVAFLLQIRNIHPFNSLRDCFQDCYQKIKKRIKTFRGSRMKIGTAQ